MEKKNKRPSKAGISKGDISDSLKEFYKESLEPKFIQIDNRFDQVDARFIEFREDIIHQFHLISEDTISKVQQVAEGVANLHEKLDRHIDESNKQNEETRREILAAIKFSYAELDKRITILEVEMEALKRRMDSLERRSIS